MNDPKKIKVWVQVILSLILLIFSLYTISTEPETSTKLKWAYGIVGIIIGYWLK